MAEKKNEPKSQIYYINLGGTIGNIGAMRYAWRARKNLYKNIAADLGVKEAKDAEEGLMYGANDPRPAVVRIHYTDSNGNAKSVKRFCEPDKISGVTTGGGLKKKKVWVNGTEYQIHRCTIVSN
jgi:hypothetical protein